MCADAIVIIVFIVFLFLLVVVVEVVADGGGEGAPVQLALHTCSKCIIALLNARKNAQRVPRDAPIRDTS